MLLTIDPSSLLGRVTLTGIVSAGVGIYGAYRLIIRGKSKDKLEIVKDRAEIDLIKHLETQRDEAYEERDKAIFDLETAENAAAISNDKIEELMLQINRLNAQISLLRQLTERLSTALDRAKNELITIKSKQDSYREDG